MDSAQWDAKYCEKGLVWSEGPNRFLVEEVADLRAGHALDLACGEGRNALWLAERGWTVCASDFSGAAIDKAKSRAAKLGLEIDFVVADARDSVDGQYDLVILFYLHIPLDALAQVLAVATDALAPGGTLLVVGHDARNLTEGFGGPPDPAVLYGPEDVTKLLPELEIDRAETVDRPVEKAGETHTALDVLVRAHRR